MPQVETAVPLDDQELRYADMGLLSDGEIMGLDREGMIVTWDARESVPVRGAAMSEAAFEGLGFLERDRLERDVARLGLSFTAPSGPRR